ncbi:MAG: DUF4912 domain-containing protein [Pirellulales bacterium]
MITTGNLQNQSKAELAAIAKRLGIQAAGLSKDQLVQAISKSANGKASKANKTAKNGKGKASTVSKSDAKSKPMVKSGKSVKVSPKASATKNSPTKTAKPTAKVNSAKSAVDVPKKAKPVSKVAVEPAKTTGKNGVKNSPTKPAPTKSVEVKSPSKTSPVKPVQDTESKKVVEKTSPSKVSGTSGASKVAVASPPAKKESESTNLSTKAALVKKPAVEKKPVVEKKKEEVPTTSPKVLKKIREMQLQKEANKDISYRPRLIKPPGATDPIFDKEPQKDRIALFVRDPFWLHATWDITRGAIERAQSALSEQWYGARPVLRLIRIEDSQATSVSETVQLEVDIRGGVRNWYIPWSGESANFRVSVGYLGINGRYHVIAQSNIVRTPAATATDAVDQHWSDLGSEGEKIFAMSGGYDSERETAELQEVLEDRLNRSLGAPTLARLGAAADAMYQRRGGFHFDMDVELVVYGSTSPDAYLTLNEEPVALKPDGTFVVRLPFPDRRQVIPAVAVARDGSHQRTIVVGVERNTKIMEPMEQEQDLGE